MSVTRPRPAAELTAANNIEGPAGCCLVCLSKGSGPNRHKETRVYPTVGSTARRMLPSSHVLSPRRHVAKHLSPDSVPSPRVWGPPQAVHPYMSVLGHCVPYKTPGNQKPQQPKNPRRDLGIVALLDVEDFIPDALPNVALAASANGAQAQQQSVAQVGPLLPQASQPDGQSVLQPRWAA
jgi:hypothetical protein